MKLESSRESILRESWIFVTLKGDSAVRKKEVLFLFSFIVLISACMFAGLVHSARLSADEIATNEDAVIALVNEARAAAGVGPVVKSEALLPAANHRAEEAAEKFSHTRSNGTAWKTVFEEFGIESEYRGENLAFGQKTPAAVMKAWMNSTGHRKNILNERFTAMAVGYYESNGVPYWSQLFIEEEGPSIREIVQQQAIEENLPIAMVDGVNLNLRSEPNTSSEAVTILLDGTEMYVIGEQGSWTQVRLADGTEGWASTKHLKFE